MASSAFKSTSKRGSLNSTTHNSHRSNSNSNPNPNPTVRKRSQSVSAISRTKQTLDINSEFSNKRENPLFWASSTSPPSGQEKSEISQITSFTKRTEKENGIVESTTGRASGTTNASASASAAERGRSVTRNSGVKNGIGRSVSRVRGRSVSRGPHGTYESDKEQELLPLTNARYNSDFKKVVNSLKSANVVRNGGDVQGRINKSQITSSQCQATECSEDDSVCSFQFSNWEDGISTCSLSEAEEKTIKAVSEQMKGDHWGGDDAASGIYETVRSEVRRAIADIQNGIESAIRRGNVNGVATTDTAGIPPDIVTPGAVELVLDIRREYAQKLEQSEERARKLRADLAVEEHRGQEFSRILKETLPDPKTANPQKSRMGRKRSSERKKMSKRLTEEAMAYFDECVSISTFDSSDFSASEDAPRTSAGPSMPVDDTVSRLHGSLSLNPPLYAPDNFSNNKQTLGERGQLVHSGEDSNLTANSSSNALNIDQVDQRSKSRGSSQQYQFSFAQKSKDMVLQNNIKNYIKHFERGVNKDLAGLNSTRSHDGAGESDLHACLESLLFDRVFFRSRVESGSLHLCGGSIAVLFSPFGSVL